MTLNQLFPDFVWNTVVECIKAYSQSRSLSFRGRTLQELLNQQGYFMYGKRNVGTFTTVNGIEKQGNFPGVSNLMYNIFSSLPQEIINKV